MSFHFFERLKRKTPERSHPTRRLASQSTEQGVYLPLEWQSPIQQEQLALAVVADQERLKFLKKAFDTTFFTPQINYKLNTLTDKDAASAYFLGIHEYLRTNIRTSHFLFKDTLLADATDALTHSVFMSLLGYTELMPATLVRSGVTPQSLEVAVAYKVPGWDGGFFVREGQHLDVGSREQRYRHIPNHEVMQRLKQLQTPRIK
ncbi:MAG: hypothetical protein Q8L34_00200 [Candidatus Woesearchaeota archaeon]|nr:hypothetical protein [Candidatus Woesearchaeota archaeon]